MESKQKSTLLSESNEHASSPSQHSTRIFHLWRNLCFTIFLFGQALSNLDDSLAVIALLLLVLKATNSVTQMEILAGCYGIDQLLSSIFAGIPVDRLNHRRFMIACDLAGIELFIFHLQHDLKQINTIVRMVCSMANIGVLLGGLLAPPCVLSSKRDYT